MPRNELLSNVGQIITDDLRLWADWQNIIADSLDKRRFPPACSIDETNNACFIVRDSTGQALGYFYFEQEPRRFSGRAAYPRRTQSERYERRAFANHELINRPRKRGRCG